MSGPIPHPARTRVEDIMAATAHHYELSRTQLVGRTKMAPVARPRQVAMYLAREISGASYPWLAKFFRRDHCTVIKGCDAVRARLEGGDEALAADIAAIRVALSRTSHVCPTCHGAGRVV